jgi:formylglycine-generating enzyme required for sulfatase activity
MSEESKLFTELPKSFRNPHEYDAEYILIPGGRYKYQGETEKEVSNIYFAKYPVTNKRYRRFIRYLDKQEQQFQNILPVSRFCDLLLEFASPIKGFADYLGDMPDSWPEKLRFPYDAEMRYNGADQPVVSISWFAARAYCLWLTELTRAGTNSSASQSTGVFRLPKDVEWEWAASSGNREYPWGDQKPSDTLANYGRTVGATTPVGRYPDGATPEGLMDMAGNVWEWMENWHERYEGTYRSLRGNSWEAYGNNLRCTESYLGFYHLSRSLYVGFRVVRSQS